MKKKCVAPGCSVELNINPLTYFFKCLYSILHGGTFSAAVVCPEHEEFLTHGEYNDGDDTTNPELVPEQKDKPEGPDNTDHIL